jgi:hypothetical protein
MRSQRRPDAGRCSEYVPKIIAAGGLDLDDLIGRREHLS